jgi:hypothetical protein
MRRPKKRKLEIVKTILPVNAVGEWVKYYSWTDGSKFLIKEVDLINRKIHGTYIIDGKELKGTKFNLCEGIATKKTCNYWYLIEGERPDFSLDDKLFEI